MRLLSIGTLISVLLLLTGLTAKAIRIRHILNSEDINNSLVMIQPTLMSYGLEAAPEPVLLDSISIRPEAVLLLDTFFHILIFHGETIANWRKAGYHEQPGYDNLAKLLEDPQEDAQVSLRASYHSLS